MIEPLLTNLNNLPDHVERSSYKPSAHNTGIVHLGLGAFHKSHQAFYTDAALEMAGGHWRILGVNMRNERKTEQLNLQNGLYTLIVNNANGPTARVIASIESAMSAVSDKAALMRTLCSPDTRIVSITVTEKGYGISREHGGIDKSDTAIVHDLNNRETPHGVLGLIVRALELRRNANIAPFTVLCCDNLPNNGQYVFHAVLDYAQCYDVKLSHWIADNVPFPNTMVDRITPSQSSKTLETAIELIGHRDYLAIETEPFHQWVIEDKFANGRPEWEAAGAMFTDSVAPFEEMKLRMLNGAHSMLAYAGVLADKTYVRDVMRDASLAKLVARHLQFAAATLSQIPGIDFQEYADDLLSRFANPEIAHETMQIATDGSQKLPQRVFEPALVAITRNIPVRPFAFTTALWMHYCCGVPESGRKYSVDDPMAPTLLTAANNDNVLSTVSQFSAIPGLIPSELSSNKEWHDEVVSVLQFIKEKGVRGTLDYEAGMVMDSQ